MKFRKSLQEKEILSILKDRDIEQNLESYCLNHSDGRTKRLSKLLAIEIQQLLISLKLHNDEYLLQGIYDVAQNLNIVSSTSMDKDSEIVDFLKAEIKIDFFTNVFILQEKREMQIKIEAPFSNLSYIGKLMVAGILGNYLIEKMKQEN